MKTFDTSLKEAIISSIDTPSRSRKDAELLFRLIRPALFPALKALFLQTVREAMPKTLITTDGDELILGIEEQYALDQFMQNIEELLK